MDQELNKEERLKTPKINSERRLGNKYRMITNLLGGIAVEKEGKYYYYIKTETAIKNICQKYFYRKLTGYKDDLTLM